MRKNLLFFATAMLLLLPALASCSSDDNEELDGWIVEKGDRKVLLSEDVPYPDSVMYYQILIPCRPITKEELPQWLCNYLIKNAASVTVVQGQWVESGEPLYGIIPSYPSSQFLVNFYADGTPFDIIPGARDDGYDGYSEFLSATSNWRCIYKIKMEYLDL